MSPKSLLRTNSEVLRTMPAIKGRSRQFISEIEYAFCYAILQNSLGVKVKLNLTTIQLRTRFRFDTHIFDRCKMTWCTLASSKRNFKQPHKVRSYCTMKRIPLHISHFLFSNESTHCCASELVCIHA